MRRSVTLRAVVLISLSGAVFGRLAADEGATEREKRFQALLTEIQDLASAEPLIQGIDTRIRVAERLAAARPEEALQFLTDARTALTGVAGARAGAVLGRSLVSALLKVDPEEAERTAAGMPPRTATGVNEDSKALAFDELTTYWLNKDFHKTTELVRLGYDTGAFRNPSGGMVLRILARDDPNEARALLARLLHAFPTAASLEDVQYLLESARAMGGIDRAQALEAADLAMAALDSDDFGKGAGGRNAASRDVRETALSSVESYLRQLGPDVYEAYQSQLDEARQRIRSAGPAESGGSASRNTASAQRQQELSWADAPASRPVPKHRLPQVLSSARREKDGAKRLELLAMIAASEDLESPSRQALVQEALLEAGRLAPEPEMIRSMQYLLLSAVRYNERASALAVAHVLAEKAASYCRCAVESCSIPEGRLECLPYLWGFIDRLNRAGISLSDWSPPDPSIRVRYLAGELDGFRDPRSGVSTRP